MTNTTTAKTKSSALRIRMDLALAADTTDMAAFGAAVQKVEELKASALDAGFVLTAEMTSRVGSFDFPDVALSGAADETKEG